MSRLPTRYGGLLALALVLAILPFVAANDVQLRLAIDTGLAAIVCVGLNLLIGYAGQISLGHAGFYGLGAYGSAILVSAYGWPPLVALLASMIGVGALAFVLARPILRLRGHYLAMVTLGLGIVVATVLSREGWLTGGTDGMAVGPLALESFTIGGWQAPALHVQGEWPWYWLVAGTLLLVTWLALNLVESPVGRALRAVRGSEAAARAAGIDPTRHEVLVFVLSAVIASLAGSLFAHHSGWLTPDQASFIRSIQYVAMVVLGGMASIFGAIIGAAILTTLPQLLTILHDHEQVVLGAVMVLTMILMPKGLVPSLAALLERRRA